MVKSKSLTLSVIIPVYNEERRLTACLDAIANQLVAPDEVIVVDNNSTDNSVAVAKSYPFVKVIYAKEQGLTYARNTGLDAAKSDILARIDADAILANNWVQRAKECFADPRIDAVTGLGASDLLYRVHWPKIVMWSWLYFMWARMIFRLPVLWGANMALRRTTWRTIRGKVIMDGQRVHEDQDVSLCVLEAGGRIIRDNRLRITLDGQTYTYLPKLLHYTARMYSTRRIHRARPEYQVLQKRPPAVVAWLAMYTVGLIFLVPFFLIGFLSFPLDWTMYHVFGVKSWID